MAISHSKKISGQTFAQGVAVGLCINWHGAPGMISCWVSLKIPFADSGAQVAHGTGGAVC